ncbi:LppA family lipoprotein [Nocardia sp. NBC_01499]|uniref:LppA family lipoprotein n=1 Tax=Nocardia sp. NBC_01499 TaxID=2903597 RepID=UPI00386924DB
MTTVARTHNWWRLAPMIALIAFTAGCGLTDKPYGEPTPPDDTTKAAETLKTLPSLEDTEARLKQAVEQIGTAATAINPALRWAWNRDRATLGCDKPYDQTNGQRAILQHYVSDTAISEQDWPRIEEATRTAAATFEATQVQILQNKPGHHDVRFSSDDGTTFGISTQQAAVITARTGCRLPKAGPESTSSTPARPTQ